MEKTRIERMTDIIDDIAVEYDTTQDKVGELIVNQVSQIVNILDLYL